MEPQTIEPASSSSSRALSNPIILRTIFESIEEEDWQDYVGPPLPNFPHDYRSYYVLTRCCRVNKLWWTMSIPLIWRDTLEAVDGKGSLSIFSLLNKVKGGLVRQQEYANHIEKGREYDRQFVEIPFSDYTSRRRPVFEQLHLPRLKELHIRTTQGFPNLNANSAPNIKRFKVEIWFNYTVGEHLHGVAEAVIEDVFGKIVAFWPDAEEVSIDGLTFTELRSLQVFVQKMQNPKAFKPYDIITGQIGLEKS